MFVTVAICTWNRSALLDATLGALANLRVPDDLRWEVLVVENDCSDDTPAVVARHAARLPLRSVVEPTRGCSFARNRALRECRGDALLFTDDDVLPDPGWLAAHVRAAKLHPDAAFLGGPVLPSYAVAPPAWLADNLAIFAGALALRLDSPPDPVLKDTRCMPYAANLLLRRSAFEERSFDTALGHVGKTVIGGEEIRFVEDLLAAGCFGVWVADAPVRHVLPAERLTTGFMRGYFHGRGVARVRSGDAEPRARLLRKHWKAQARVWTSRRKDSRWARAFKTAATTRGALDELRAARSRAAG